jgi:hypothetical protein
MKGRVEKRDKGVNFVISETRKTFFAALPVDIWEAVQIRSTGQLTCDAYDLGGMGEAVDAKQPSDRRWAGVDERDW